MMNKEDILKEVEKIRYLYGLKRVVRYHLDRNDEELETESVAEHIYAVEVLARYFLTLEDPDEEWNHSRIYQLLLWHDLDELETGDKISYLKTKDDRVRSDEAHGKILAKVPLGIASDIESCLKEYKEQKTIESRFAKAIDRIEPSFHLFSDQGKQIHNYHRTTRYQHDKTKTPYMKDFPKMQRFNEVLVEEMEKNGHFTSE